MHRFLKLQGTSFYKYSRESFSTLNTSANSCLLCKLNNICKGTFRYNSSNPNPNLKIRKPRKRNKKEYAELLIVTDNSSCQRRANVKKLTFSELELLASTNLNLSELHKLKEILQNPTVANEYSYNNLNIIDNLPSTSASNIDFVNINSGEMNEKTVNLTVPEHMVSQNVPPKDILKDTTSTNETTTTFFQQPLPAVDIVDKMNESDTAECPAEEEELESIKAVNTLFQPEVTDEQISEVEEVKDPPDKRFVRVGIDRNRKKEIATKSVAAYIEVCGHLKNPQRGLGALNFHRVKSRKINSKNYIPIKSKKVYNTLLRAFAHKGDFHKIKEVLDIMQEEHISLNVHSYAAIFECISRNNFESYQKELGKFVKQASAQGITFDNIMNEGVFLNNERDLVLKAIHHIDPKYQPKYNHPRVLYNNPLVNHLNNSEQEQPFVTADNESGGLFTSSTLTDRIDKQIRMEKDGYVTIQSIVSKAEVSDEVERHRNSLAEHYKMWEEEALKAFNRDLATLTAQRSAINMEPYIRSIPAKDCIAIIVEEAKKMSQGSETYSPTVSMLYKELGSKVYARYKIICKQKNGVLDKVTNIHKTYCSNYANTHKPLDILPEKEVTVNPRQIWQWIDHGLKKKGATIEMDHQQWAPAVLTFIGKFLYHIVMYDIKVDVNVLRNTKHKNYLPAFYTIFRNQGRLVKEEVKPHPVLSKLYRQSIPETLTFPTCEVPMVCPPIPWISTDIGGYLVSPCDVIRLPTQATSQKGRLNEVGSQQLYPSLDALNQLASVPWKVNTKILDVILEVFNNGGSSSLDVPEPTSSLIPPPIATPEMDKSERYHLFKQRMQYRRKKAEMYSLWCDCLYRLSLANHFRDTIFWLPHNMDFRGRVYPVPPHLNHLGSDLARSMLIFAEPRPLGPNGLDWIKIHLINLTGLKKNDSVKERLKYANDILPDILDSADKPLTGRRWWAQSDEPWQTLSCCMEIADIVRSPEPEKFLSHFPIHQDGSCNGLQHYAALGRDSSGAYSVNLAPSEKPQDVYSAVVKLVEQQRVRDAENGIEIAKVLEGFIKRKVIKQTIMTTVYGVTRYGARLQIARQLKDIDDFPKEHVWAASSYLTGRTFDSLRTMFTSTREIQDWFTECARLISSVGSQHVEWVTPLGLPIVQPYFKYRKASTGTSTYENYIMDKYELTPQWIQGVAIRDERGKLTQSLKVFTSYFVKPPSIYMKIDDASHLIFSLQLQWVGKPLSTDQLGYGEQAYVLSDEAPIRAENRDSRDWTALRILIEKKPNVMKQKNAFPPNFIHSLDSSHMMLTSLHCERAGITFVSVHDCYWTHPSTVHIMNKICREQFVALHSEPILEDLSNFLWEKFSYGQSDFTDDGSVVDLTKKKLNRVLRQLPKTGEFDINQVLKSVYFFS